MKLRLILFLGGTGCGKTSMILKMAASEKFYGKQNVGIISTDSFKSGGYYPIESFSKISGIESRLAETAGKLPLIMEDFSDKDVILVDTPGKGMNFKNKVSEIQKIIDLDESKNNQKTVAGLRNPNSRWWQHTGSSGRPHYVFGGWQQGRGNCVYRILSRRN